MTPCCSPDYKASDPDAPAPGQSPQNPANHAHGPGSLYFFSGLFGFAESHARSYAQQPRQCSPGPMLTYLSLILTTFLWGGTFISGRMLAAS
ncbi:MAG TPA: hypothetical protein VK857_12865, partial [Desulforhopalus sp.]|nr:hypothetical protein [Desulforhopalus sp.]